MIAEATMDEAVEATPRCASCISFKSHTLNIGRCWNPKAAEDAGLKTLPLVVLHYTSCEHFEDRLTKESRAMLEARR